MKLTSFLIRFLAKRQWERNKKNKFNALDHQNKIFKKIINNGVDSLFGKNNSINKSIKYIDFKKLIKLNDYESIRPYVKKISEGETNILTKGVPKYFAITSGTTSGTKYIPLTMEMLNFQMRAIKELLLLYSYQSGNCKLSNTGMMFIQGSPVLRKFNKIPFAKLSGITARHIPFFLKKNRYPSMKTNCISNWDEKIKKIVLETFDKDMGVIGGIPPWVITYFRALLAHTQASNIKEIFPNFELYIHGGTSFENYKNSIFKLCGDIDTLETYPASEGFFAYQDNLNEKHLLLLTNHGVFYEFVEVSRFKKGDNERVCLADVELGKNYVLIVSTVSGLWAYNTGDTIRFVSINPYKIVFCGRVSQYCSVFGEHVIEKEVQTALTQTLKKSGGEICEFSVCPKIKTNTKESHHEWFIEFVVKPKNMRNFEESLNREMETQNIYYKDLIKSNIISTLKVICVKRGGFDEYMKSIGKFGGQNKCPHLSNDRKIGDFLSEYYED